MKNFARSILNYFAAFNETRFRFNRKLPYAWTEDPFTLELSVFPEFQKELLKAVVAGKPFAFKVQKGQHVVDVSPDQLKTAVLSVLGTELNAGFLQEAEERVGQRMAEALRDRPPQERASLVALEAMREFNLAFRQQLLSKVTEVQKDKIKELQQELGFSAVPPSSFNPQREVQRVYSFLRINKFSLLPEKGGEKPWDVLNRMLEKAFA